MSRSLGTRLVAAMVLVAVVVLGLSYVTTYVLVRRELQENALTNLRSRTTQLRPLVATLAAASAGDTGRLRARLRGLRTELRAGLRITDLRAVLVAPDGTVNDVGSRLGLLASSRPGRVGPPTGSAPGRERRERPPRQHRVPRDSRAPRRPATPRRHRDRSGRDQGALASHSALVARRDRGAVARGRCCDVVRAPPDPTHPRDRARRRSAGIRRPRGPGRPATRHGCRPRRARAHPQRHGRTARGIAREPARVPALDLARPAHAAHVDPGLCRGTGRRHTRRRGSRCAQARGDGDQWRSAPARAPRSRSPGSLAPRQPRILTQPACV